jgi:hypothetical protein
VTGESLVVGIMVVGCAIFSVWRLMSARLQLKTLEALAVLPASAGGNWVAHLRRQTLTKLSGGCAACQGATRTVNANVQSENRRLGEPRR